MLVKTVCIRSSQVKLCCDIQVKLIHLDLYFILKANMSTNSIMPKVLITHPDVPEVAIKLLSAKCEVILCKEQPNPTKQDIIKKAPGVEGIFWASHCRCDAEILDAAGPQLKVIGTMSVGTDHIDIPELRKRGIKLGNTPKVLDASVAELTILLMLGASRRAHEGRLHIENGTWVSGVSWMLGKDIRNSVIGIVGLGRIGLAIAKRVKGFSPNKIIYSGHREKSEASQVGAQFVTQEQLLKESDFIISAVPLTPETKEMFNVETFSKMKKTAIFVNISRGAVVNQEDLIKALETGKIFAAGLDVMTPEPLPKDHKLLTLKNCFITPHLGSATVQTRNDMADLTAKNILRGLAGEEPFAPVH